MFLSSSAMKGQHSDCEKFIYQETKIAKYYDNYKQEIIFAVQKGNINKIQIISMANIFTSSIGKKLIMSISGLFLILFLLVHLVANSASLFSEEAFEIACEIMATPFVTVMVPVLAFGFIIHIIYAIYLTLYNRRARGNERYAIPHKGHADSWSSKNMLVLGIIVLGFLAFHLTHFWADMQLQEFMGNESENPNALMYATFKSPVILILYIVWFCALWFHLTHGFWSAFQTLGFNNNIWLKRWKVIGQVIVTIFVLGFIVIALVAFMRANGYMPIAA